MSVLCRTLAILALCLISTPAVADCGLLRRVDRLYPLIEAVALRQDEVARFDLELAVRSLDAATIRSVLLRSGRPEWVAPVTQYVSAIRRITGGSDSSSRSASIAAGRAFVGTAIANACVEGQPEDGTSSTSVERPSATSLRQPTDAQVMEPGYSDPISKRFPLIAGPIAIAVMIVAIVLVLRSARQRLHLKRSERLPCRYWTRLLTGESEYPCLVIDFSAKGCKISVPKGLPKVREVKIVLDERTLPAKIVWRTEFFAGIRVSSGVPQSLVEARNGARKAGLAA